MMKFKERFAVIKENITSTQNILSPRVTRLVIFVALAVVLLFFNYLITSRIFPTGDIQNLWFYSGIFMMLFSMFFIELYYTAPTNVIANTTAIILVLLSIRNQFDDSNITWWRVGYYYSFLLLSFSIIATVLNDKDKSPDCGQNILAERLKAFSVRFGSGKILYSGIFLYFILSYYEIGEPVILALVIFWWFLVVTEPQKFLMNWKKKITSNRGGAVGEIFSVQSKKIFLTKLFDDRPGIQKFDIVIFKYSMQDSGELVITGIVFDTYLLNQEKWIKILQLKIEKEKNKIDLEKNVVYKISDKNEKENLGKELNVHNFVGVIIEGSEIGKIKFEYSKKTDDLQEGDLLELEIGSKKHKTYKKLFYQVINGTTDKEKLEARNESGFIRGEAIQLGEWKSRELSFQKFGWVPPINTAIFKADTIELEKELPEFSYPYYKLGKIPGTNLPSVINLNEAVSHHMALLGVTGSGKSFITFEIIENLMVDTKVICIDFTGEYVDKLAKLKPIEIIDKTKLSEVEEMIAKKEVEEMKGKYKNSLEIIKYKNAIQEKLLLHIREFILSKDMVGIFELPDLSNSTFILEFTQMFMDSIFKYAKENKGQQICIVIEEAHTVIPETNFLGDLGDYGSNKALVSKMSQIALQGRKYGVGLLVIGQRSANISKTVLTQCNTVVCMQAFDETSFNFLSNYIGKDLVHALPNLKQYHAIVTGKAVKANIPMIIDLTREIVITGDVVID